ncbi:MAG: tRNA (N(6)-L-threonylcarbamoyladenosine(37)-C(2))-methylthiotransferase MtaB [Alphaproteobacteria bacterium]|nr:tRNA (N(6)-L-threonylcarbamoyladenosine(37)-C(2))-methylthiotransferase MtaB [Alphaproteobacteria bacterium]
MSGTQVINFGCRLNQYEAELMRVRAMEAGLENAIIINSCAVTAEATRQARQAVRKARREQPGARIIVTGCAAQIEPQRFADMPEVDVVLGNIEKLQSASYATHGLRNDFGAADGERVRVNDIMSVRETAGHLIEGLEGRARAFVQIQNGCDHRCSFCIIPFGRGNSRSVPAGEVVAQIRRLTANGYLEVVLTGVDITSYGADLPGRASLGSLVSQILKHVPELVRLRLSSLDVIELDEALFRAIGEEKRLMPHLHLSLQSGDDMILKRMKRRHSRQDAIALAERLRNMRPDMVLGADLIAGFPTESEAMFENSLRLIEDCDLTYLHVFPYSARAGTPAARMPQVPGAVRKARAARLRLAGDQAVQRHLQRLIGASQIILMETDTCGRTECYTEVELDQPCPSGGLATVKVTGIAGRRLTGARVSC